MTGCIELAREGAVATVTLSHPGRLNAMSRAMWRELRTVAQTLQAMPGLGCVVVRGQGGHFCAGGDISEYPSFRFDAASLREFHEGEVWGALAALLACDAPLLAQIEGSCMGAGLEIASCCDLRVAAADARFGAPVARLGFPMAPREAALVTRTVGELSAREMLLAAAVLDAAEMKTRGFLNRVVPPARCAPESQELAAQVAALSPLAARSHKQLLRAFDGAGAGQPAQAQTMQALVSAAYDYAADAQHREGIAAFLQKRPARF